MSEARRVGNAILEAFRSQRVDPTGLGSLTGIIPSLDWMAIGRAAIEATDHYREMQNIFESAADRIDDYDRREAAGEDVSGEARPRMPGGSDW